MRILITNASLRQRAGSELVACELAVELQKMGHQVLVFSPRVGLEGVRLAREMGLSLVSFREIERIREFGPDVVHLQHWPVDLLLREAGIHAPRVYFFLGHQPPLENPPPIIRGSSPSWAGVSKMVVDNVSKIRGWDKEASQNAIIHNWADTSSNQVRRIPTNLRKIVIVSNHFPVKYLDMINDLGSKLGFSTDVYGKGYKVARIDSDLLLQFDAVVSLGRTAILSSSLGIPTLVLDYLGLDGWVTQGKLSKFVETNFSGWIERNHDFSMDELAELLKNPPGDQELVAIAEELAQTHTLGRALEKLIPMYERALLAPQEEYEFGKDALAARDYLKEISALEKRIQRGPLKRLVLWVASKL